MTEQGPSARQDSAATAEDIDAGGERLRWAGSPPRPTCVRCRQTQLADVATEIREFLVEQTSKRGGHLGPNLGVVELTMALHLVFDSPKDPILFDTGHQAYVHKIITGRADRFDRLRTRNGLSGYPSRAESEHDWIENSHASTSLSYADGLAKAFALRKERDRTVVAVIGDGALTGGMAWEALNNIAASDRPLVIVLNDNGRSYAPTTGGMAQRMAAMRLRPGYERMLGRVKSTLPRTPVVGRPLYSALHAAKSAVKDWFLPQALFADLGLKYLGPIDGHDVEALSTALIRARDFRGPVLVHCVTQKGQGYPPAESDDAEQMHSPPAFDPTTGKPKATSSTTWTHVFGREMVVAGARASGRRRHHRRDVRADRAGAVRHRVPGPGLRRRDRRATRADLRGRAGDGRHASGGRGVRDVPEPRLRPVADGLRAAPAGRHRRAGPGRRHR